MKYGEIIATIKH